MEDPIIYYNGKFMPESEVRFSVRTHALHYGTGCFEGIRAYYSEADNSLLVFRMKEHYERLARSGKILFMKLPKTVDELCAITVELLAKNFAKQDLYIRPLLYKSDPAVGNFHLQKLNDGFFIYTTPLGRYLDVEKGIRTNISSWRRIPDYSIPPRGKITGSYVNTALAKTESLLAGYEEALLLDNDGHVVEGSAENLFMIKNGALVTPDLSDDILQGITRETIIMLAEKEFNLPVIERSIDRSEIYQADEVFLVGTGAEVSPVISVDAREIGNGGAGPITKKIKNYYFDLVHGKISKHKNFITRVTK